MFKKSCNIVIYWLVLVLFLHACRSHKTATSTAETDVYASCYPIESITVSKCKLNIAGGNRSYQLNGSLYIDPDSICYFRGTMMVEIIRGVIYRDSFAIINRMERICYRGKTEYLNNYAGITVTPESLFLLFTADRCEKIYREKFNYKIANKNGIISLQGKNGTSMQITLNATDQTIKQITAHHPRLKNSKFSIAYDSYRRYQQFILPVSFDIFAGNDKNFVKIEAGFQDIQLNQLQHINFTIPSGYQTIYLQ
ncbi:MAG: DUF4292 domain-containing protein [Prevotellaceae bacterium]|jgi:hypothetical protein|nr:DUF4292 domain-containing protein [Prevotellaceae bacterium]